MRYGGRIQPCCQNSTSLGNINDKDFIFDNVWNGEKIQNIRQLIIDNKYEEAGCNKNCNILYNIRKTGEMELFSPGIVEAATKNKIFSDNISLLKNELSMKNIKIDSFPIMWDIQPTEACNMRCIMCHQDHTNPKKLNSDSIERILKINHQVIYSLCVQGGEVFIDQKYKDLLLNLKESFSEYQTIQVITNASLLSYSDLDKMTQGDNPIKFIISADGVDEQIFKSIRQSSHFNKVMNNIKYLSKIQMKKNLSNIIQWNFVVMKSNFFQIKEALKLSSQLNIEINFQGIMGEYENENIFNYNLIDKEEALTYINDTISLSEKLNTKASNLHVIKQKLEDLE